MHSLATAAVSRQPEGSEGSFGGRAPRAWAGGRD